MKIKSLKIVIVLIVFAISFVGFTFTTRTKKIGGESVNVSVISLGTKAQAYCNEARYSGEVNNGLCDGAFSSQSSRCWFTDDGPNCWQGPGS